jgi:hypothetical protein
MAKIKIEATEERLKEIFREAIREEKAETPEERYITTERLAEIMKVSVQMINNYKQMAKYQMPGAHGENLWDWKVCLEWRKKHFEKNNRGGKRQKGLKNEKSE